MATLLIFTISLLCSAVCLSPVGTRDCFGIDIKCEEVKVKITVARCFFREKRVPFKPEYLRLGGISTQRDSCGPEESGSEMVFHVGLQECGTVSSVDGEWLVYSNQLLLRPAVVPVSSGGGIVKGEASIIPVQCRYERKQTVTGEPLTPTWLPMASTISAFGLLNFSLRTVTGDCSSPRSSSVYQQGEAVYLQASVEAPLHPPLLIYVDSCVATLKPDPSSLPSYEFITKHGCLMDSVLPGSSSKFLLREQDNSLCFSVQAFHFKQESGERVFISCNLRASLKHNPPSRVDKACFFHRPTFSWRAAGGGDHSVCDCCGAGNCFRNTGPTTQPETVTKRKAETAVGPLYTLPRSHWLGRLSVHHQNLSFPAL